MKKILMIIAAGLLTANVWAQSPQKMSYQAVIRNSGNALITSTAIGMQISILQGSPNGVPVYVETQKPTTNANGLATIEIGSGTIVSGTFSGINWSAGPYYLKVQTDPGGGNNYTITGTSQLLSVPYALYSGSGGTLKGVTASLPLSSSGGTAPDISLSGKVPVANLPSLAGDATGTIDAVTVVKLQNRTLATTVPTNGQVLTYNVGNSQWEPQSLSNSGNSGVWSLTGNNIYYNSGKVGIGSSNPQGKLEIVGQNALRLVGYQPFMTLLDSNANYASSRIQAVAGDLSLLTESYLSGANPFSFLKLANNGNVGIGSAEPVGRLEVVGQDAIRLVGYQPFLTFHDAKAGYARARIQGVAGDLSFLTESYLSGVNPFSFLKLANNGNVGIGSAEPVGRLEVVGQDALRLVGYQPFLTLLDVNAGYTRGRIQSANGNILFYPESSIVGGTPAVTISSGSGNVRIGTKEASGYKLSVTGKIICEELKVQLAANWPDYVFDKKYQLMPINELAQNIEQDKHLPGLPSAAEVKLDGISVGDMQAKLLEKVEQLTLYVIQLQKQNDELTKKDAEIMKLIHKSIDGNH
jgi:hypothetical protein